MCKQVYAWWLCLTEDGWKHEEDQIKSARILLTERDDVDTWELDVPGGVVVVAWGVKPIADQLTGRVVEITLDATCEYKSGFSCILTLKQIIQTRLGSSSTECWESLMVLGS